jgi:N-acetylglutamate synthase-like GNAT family acetyltransferase
MPPSSESLSHPGFSIRRATNDDIPAIRSVLLAVRTEQGVLSYIGADDADLNDIETNYFGRGGYFEVVEDAAKRIVGCAGLYPLSPQRAELCKMYLENSVRGHGLGRRLLEEMLAAARRGGFSEVWLETHSVLTVATGLYRKYGFQPVEPEQLLPPCDEAYLLRLS